MRHNIFNYKSDLFWTKIDGSTPTQAVKEAIEFATKHNAVIELYCNGFTFLIEDDSKLEDKMTEYNYWLTNKTE